MIHWKIYFHSDNGGGSTNAQVKTTTNNHIYATAHKKRYDLDEPRKTPCIFPTDNWQLY